MSNHPFNAPSLEEMNGLLAGYVFESQLSANEVGAVYYALQKSLHRHVALKLFSKTKGSDESFLASLKLASSKMEELEHPNLIGFIDSGLIDGMPFLVMEFVPGKSLHRSTHGHAIDFKQAQSITEEICDGLAYAHGHGVVHGNLMPLNILLTQSASPKIGNFAMGRGIHTLSDVDIPSHFSAPEVLAGEPHTIASDVYSLGAMLYELITATPWRVGAPRASELEGIPQAVHAVIEKACASDPAQRHGGATEFSEALRKASTNKLEQGHVAVAPAARSNAMQMVMSTSGSGLWLKIVVIIVLLFAIKQVWDYRKAAEQRVQITSNGDSQAAGKNDSNFEMTKRQRETREQSPTPQPQHNPEAFPDDPETPMESLARLRDALVAGTFGELPIGSLSMGGTHLFLVEEAMSWDEAVAYAHQHGGTLALPTDAPAWANQEPFAGKSLWLGAGRGGSDAYTMLNAEVWQPSMPPIGNGSHLHLDSRGSFRMAPASTSMAYVIQWAEGSKPMSLDDLLVACAKTMRSDKAVYPPGTIASGARHYLPVSRPMTWGEAALMAQSAGGRLMVISDDRESLEVRNLTSLLLAGPRYWMGAQLLGENWHWSSGEPWRAVEWINISNAASDGAAMVLKVGSGLDAMNASAMAEGLIIEWSDDAETNKAGAGVQVLPLASPSELTETARKLVAKVEVDKETAHKNNTDKLAWDLTAHLRGLNKSMQELWAPEIEKLKSCVQNNRLLKETIDTSGATLSPFMADLCDYLIRKQGEIDEQHLKSLQVIYASYLKKLGEIEEQAKARGQVKAQLAASELIANSQNLDAWISRMSAGTP